MRRRHDALPVDLDDAVADADAAALSDAASHQAADLQEEDEESARRDDQEIIKMI